MRLSQFERQIYVSVTAALVGAKANEALADGPGFAHRVQDAAMHQVGEVRTRTRAERMRQQRRTRR